MKWEKPSRGKYETQEIETKSAIQITTEEGAKHKSLAFNTSETYNGNLAAGNSEHLRRDQKSHHCYHLPSKKEKERQVLRKSSGNHFLRMLNGDGGIHT